MTLKETLTEGTRLLKSSHIDTPALDANMLLAETLNLSREELIIRGKEEISDEDYEKFFHLLSRRLGGECIAHILGRKEFRYLTFNVNPNVLVPRPDTEILVEAALEHIDNNIEPEVDKISLLDLCTGSGAVAISLKYERPRLRVSASDICKKALETAAGNAKRLLSYRLLSRRLLSSQYLDDTIMFIESNLLEKIEDKFNIIVCNPPYIPSSELSTLSIEVRREPVLALDGGCDGLKYIKEIIPQAKNYLLPKGALFLEADPRQMPTIRELLEKNHYRIIKIHRDLSNQERVISGKM
ncbi:MAG: peptide chain release factor N(5)-glutamine methyltransferase [Treponema sp.]|nr:peptide chain release factor N(5)-glutamine methyltransferase [Treponema sp.]